MKNRVYQEKAKITKYSIPKAPHYENTPIQMYRKKSPPKLKIFR